MNLVPASVQSLFKPVPVTVGPITKESLPRNPQFLRVVGDYYDIEPSLQGEALIAKLPWNRKPRDSKLALALVQKPYKNFRDKAFAEATLKFLREDYFRFRPDEKTRRIIDSDATWYKKLYQRFFGKTEVVESVVDKIEKNWRVDEDLLNKGTFAEVYKTVLGFDVEDLIRNDQLYRWHSLLKGVFGMAKWAVKNAYPLAASAVAYAAVQPAFVANEGFTQYISTHYNAGILLLGLLPLLGMRHALSPVFLRALQGATAAINRVFKKARGPLDAITAMLKDEQPHYILAKFLGFAGKVKKYAKVGWKHGGDGVKLELEKDCERPYLWWESRNTKIKFRKNAKAETSALGLAKLYTGLQHTLLQLVPSGQSQTVGRTIESLGTLAWVLSLGLVLNQGKFDPAFLGSLAASAGMGAVAATVANNHVENTRKFNKALAKIYTQAYSFAFALTAILFTRDTNPGMIAYGLGTLFAIGATNYILPKGKKVEKKAEEPRLAA